MKKLMFIFGCICLYSYIWGQDLIVKNLTQYPLKVYYSFLAKPANHHRSEPIQTKVKVFPRRSVNLGKAQKTMITNVKISKKSLFQRAIHLDTKSFDNALQKARHYTNGAITLEFSLSADKKSLYTTVVPEKESYSKEVGLTKSK